MIDAYIAEHGTRLFGLCVTLCGNRADAEDLYQETWLRVMRKLDGFDASRPFGPWLTSVCVNLYRSRLRRIARSPLFDGFASSADKERVLEGTAAQGEPDAEQERAALRDAVDRLPGKLRLAVILYYYEGRDIASVASVLSVPAGTVKSRLSKARETLRRTYGTID